MAQNENTKTPDPSDGSKSIIELFQGEPDFPLECLVKILIVTQIGLAVVDRDLRFIGVNQRFSDIDGHPIQVHPGRTSLQLLGSLAGQFEDALRIVFETEMSMPNVEIVGRISQRTQPGRWFGDFFPLTNKHSGVTHVGVFIVEIENSPTRWREFGQATNLNPPSSVTRSPVQDFLDALSRWQASHNLVPFDHPSSVLSPRELEILRLLAQGECNKEIAWSLGVSVKTVESHRSRIMEKVGASSLVHLVHYAFKHHLVQIQY
jgi:DNA-binding CsgD family transcriptional regulator